MVDFPASYVGLPEGKWILKDKSFGWSFDFGDSTYLDGYPP